VESSELNGSAPDGGPSGAEILATARTPEEIDELFGAFVMDESATGASWRSDLRDFELMLSSGRSLHFRDCLQVSFHRSPSAVAPWPLGGSWADEPSPLLLSLDPQVRFLYRHLVVELGEGLLRVAFRAVELHGTAGSA
jgi:hypothetical protein